MNEKRLYQILLAAHTTEKSLRVAENYRHIAFKVAQNATKLEIKHAVEKIFKVVVTAVRVINVKGKTRRFKQKKGKKADTKKALVFLQKGHDINLAEFEN